MSRDKETGKFTSGPEPRTHCNNGHDITYPGSTRARNHGGRWARVCSMCYKNMRAKQNAAAVEKRRKRKEERLRLHPEEYVKYLEADKSPKIYNSPFNVTMRQMEQELGKPYAKWTRPEHREQTRRMYAVLGWPPDKKMEGTR